MGRLHLQTEKWLTPVICGYGQRQDQKIFSISQCRLLSTAPSLFHFELNPSVATKFYSWAGNESSGQQIYSGCLLYSKHYSKIRRKKTDPVFPHYLLLPKLLPQTEVLMCTYVPGKFLHIFENQQLVPSGFRQRNQSLLPLCKHTIVTFLPLYVRYLFSNCSPLSRSFLKGGLNSVVLSVQHRRGSEVFFLLSFPWKSLQFNDIGQRNPILHTAFSSSSTLLLSGPGLPQTHLPPTPTHF